MALGLLLLTACSERGGEARREIGAARVVEPAAGEIATGPRWNATVAQRFGMGRMPAASGMSGGSELAWDTPTGWVELAPRQMRQANFLAGGDPSAECYLTLLPGDAGGLAANVNRWRNQMSLPPIDAEELAALPRAPLYGEDAVLLELEGSFAGMGGGETADGYGMLALLRSAPSGSVFFKLTGPREVVAAERAAFLALARSFRDGGGDPHAGHDHAGHDHGADDQASGHASDEDGFFVPDGWRMAPERPFRALSFWVGPGEDAECYVTVLNGDGGGLRSNVDRWRSQLGLGPVDDGELAELETVPMQGREGTLVEIHSTDGSSGMLATVCFLDDSSLFVRLTGPREIVERERESFVRFCTLLGGPQ